MKDFGSFFSLRDFFNYYMAGVTWLLAVFLIVLWFPGMPPAAETLSYVKQQLDALGSVVVGVLLVILPYITGLSARPLAQSLTTAQWEKEEEKGKGNNIEKENFGYTPKNKKMYQASSSPFSSRHLCGKHYKGNPKLLHRRRDFFWIRAYVVDHGGAAAELATRTYDLMNLSESLFLPVPLLSGILTYKLTSLLIRSGMNALPYLPADMTDGCINAITIIIGIPLAIYGCQNMRQQLWQNYNEFREDWVKHTYRAFLVIKAREYERKAGRTDNE